MKSATKILYFLCFFGLAAVGALALNRVTEPSMSAVLLTVVGVAVVAGAPGLVHRKAWPLAPVLLLLGSYLVIRAAVPLPTSVEGIAAQYHFYVDQLREGGSLYLQQLFPLSVGEAPELGLLVALCLYGILGLAAFLALSIRRATPGIALIMVLLGFSLTVDSSRRALWPALLFLVLAAGMLVLSRGLRRSRWRLREVVAGGAVGVVACLLALVLMGTAPAAAPAPWQDWKAWDPFGQHESVYTFNWLQNYPQLLDPGENVEIMRVESDAPSYWRANTLETFTGAAWVSSQTFPRRLVGRSEGGSYVYDVPPLHPSPAGTEVTQTFQIQSVYTNYFFSGGDPLSLTFDQEVSLRTNDAHALHVRRALGPTLEYTLSAVVPELKPEEFVGQGRDYPESLASYLRLPFPGSAQIRGSDKEKSWQAALEATTVNVADWLPLYELNQRIVGDATDPYEITLRIEKYLRKFYQYSLTPPASQFSSPYAAFLFGARSGYCQHFSGAMALLLRFNGIPSRVAVGFTSGENDGNGVYMVSTNDAHAWTEVYFPLTGWVAFDSTPGRNLPTEGASSTSPGFINPFTEDPSGDATTATTTVSPTQTPEEAAQTAAGGDSRGVNWLGLSRWIASVVGAIAAIIAWPFVRNFWRERGLRHGSRERRFHTSLRLLRKDLADYGLLVTSAHTFEEMMAVVGLELGLFADHDLAKRVDAVLWGDSAVGEEDIDQIEAIRREAIIRLRRRRGWVRTGWAWYGVSRSVSPEGI